MKNQFLLILLLFFGILTTIGAQAPASIKYQAVARKANGEVLKNQSVNFHIQLLEDGINGMTAYSETHQQTTNEFGIVHFNIGEGDNATSDLRYLNWGSSEYYIKVELDPAGGTDYKHMGTAQLVTVPYAFFANNGVQFSQDIECGEETEGMIRYNYDSKTLEVCNGSDWVELGGGGTSFNCGESLLDSRDGNSYATIKIGGQCWMAENLKYGEYRESVFTNESHADVSNNGTVEVYALDNETSNLDLYGALYDWNEMMSYQSTESGQGICPDGWHIPSYDEYVELVESVGGWLVAGKELKMGGSSGFNFPLGGNRREKGNFTGEETGSLWTSTISGSHPDSRAWNIYFIEGGDNGSHRYRRHTFLQLHY